MKSGVNAHDPVLELFAPVLRIVIEIGIFRQLRSPRSVKQIDLH
jgi:hypothetical protein